MGFSMVCCLEGFGFVGKRRSAIPAECFCVIGKFGEFSYNQKRDRISGPYPSPFKTLSRISAKGSIAFFTSSTVLVWAPASNKMAFGRKWRLYLRPAR